MTPAGEGRGSWEWGDRLMGLKEHLFNNELCLVGIALFFGNNFYSFCGFFFFNWVRFGPVIIHGCFLDIGSCQKSDLQRKKSFYTYHKISLSLYCPLALSESEPFECFHSTLKRPT